MGVEETIKELQTKYLVRSELAEAMGYTPSSLHNAEEAYENYNAYLIHLESNGKPFELDITTHTRLVENYYTNVKRRLESDDYGV